MPTLLIIYSSKLAPSTLLAKFTLPIQFFLRCGYTFSMSETQPYHHGNLRQALIDTGLNALEESGLEALSLRALAESLGVSKAAPYRHFKTKNDLLAALAAEGYQLLADLLENSEEALLGLKRSQIPGEMYRIYGDFALSRPELYRLMFSRLGNSLHSERCRRNAERAFACLGKLAAAIQGDIPDSRKLILSLYASLHGWVMLLMDDLIPPEVGVTTENWRSFALIPKDT